MLAWISLFQRHVPPVVVGSIELTHHLEIDNYLPGSQNLSLTS
jgi:hypothetical protein